MGVVFLKLKIVVGRSLPTTRIGKYYILNLFTRYIYYKPANHVNFTVYALLMKKVLFLSCLSLCSISAFCQSSIFLQPVAGIGAANVNHVYYTGQATSDDYAINFDGGLLGGFYTGKWVFSTGLLYLRTGSKVPVALTDPLGNPAGTSYLHYRLAHFVLPFTAGRAFAISKKVSVTPSAGIGLSYNISASFKDDIDHRIFRIQPGVSNNYENSVTCYGLFQAEFAWRMSSAFDLTCAPAFNYMLNRMFLPQFSPDVVYQHDYSLLLNLGIKWHFAKKEKPVKPKTEPAAKKQKYEFQTYD